MRWRGEAAEREREDMTTYESSPGFDHHCVWFAQCIGLSSTLKPFLQVLVLGIVSILTGSLPVYPILYHHLRAVVRLTWSSHPSGDTLRRIWWRRWWGWAGGPVYRYVGGLFLGYIYYAEIKHQHASGAAQAADDAVWIKAPRSGDSGLYEPKLSWLIITAAATMVLMVMVAMVAIVFRTTIMKGQTSLEIERARRGAKRGGKASGALKLWVPEQLSTTGSDGLGTRSGKVVLVPHHLPIFDRGPGPNFRLIMGDKVWHWFLPWNPAATIIPNDGVEWPISDHWFRYLSALPPCLQDD